MAKFIMSIGENAYDILSNEAKNRDVTVQQLLRAVVVPDWIKQNSNGQPIGENDSNLLQPPIYGENPAIPGPSSRLSPGLDTKTDFPSSIRRVAIRLLVTRLFNSAPRLKPLTELTEQIWQISVRDAERLSAS